MSCDTSAHDQSVFDQLPEPDVVRERLGRLLRETRLLRRLLPLAVEAAEERRHREVTAGEDQE